MKNNNEEGSSRSMDLCRGSDRERGASVNALAKLLSKAYTEASAQYIFE
jgi:hypothetical protein